MADESAAITIGELVESGEATVKTGPFGTQLSASEYVESGIPVINVRNIGYGSIRQEKLEYLDEKTADRLSTHLLKSGDIVFGRKGAVDRHAYVTPEHDNWFQGSDCIRLRVKSDRVDNRFLSYSFLTEDHKNWMMAQGSHGATMASLNQGIISRIPLNLPPIATQRKNANILSAYDDLIEINTRRIAILEEMARRIYEEWFVHFRYPGHENVPLVESELGPIPEGWEVSPIGQLIRLHIGGGWGKEEPDNRHTEIAAVIRGTDIPKLRSGIFDSVPVRFHTIANLKTRRLEPTNLILEVSGGSKGQPVGRTLYVSERLLTLNDFDTICASFCKRLVPDDEIVSSEQLYFAIEHAYSNKVLDAYQVQSTGIINFQFKQFLSNFSVVIPSRALKNRFPEIAKPMLEEISLLVHQIELLRSSRDFLLPKLIGGSMSIERDESMLTSLMNGPTIKGK